MWSLCASHGLRWPISNAAILQLIALILRRDCKKQTILKLSKKEFIDLWPKAVDAIERVVEYGDLHI